MSKITKRARTRNERSERKVRRDKFDRVQNERRAAAGKPLCRVHTEWIRLRRAQAKARIWLSHTTQVVGDVNRARHRADELFGFIAFVAGKYFEPLLEEGLKAGSRMLDVRIQAFISSAWHRYDSYYGSGLLREVSGRWWAERCLVCGQHSIQVSCWMLGLKRLSRDVEALKDLGVYIATNGVDFEGLQSLRTITKPWSSRFTKARLVIGSRIAGGVEEWIDQLALGPVSMRKARMALEFCYSAWRGRPKRLPRFSDLFRVAPLDWDEGPIESLWNMYCGVRTQFSGVWRTRMLYRVSGLGIIISTLVQVIGEFNRLFVCPEVFRDFWTEHASDLVLPDFNVATFLLGDNLPRYSDLVSDLELDRKEAVERQEREERARVQAEEERRRSDAETLRREAADDFPEADLQGYIDDVLRGTMTLNDALDALAPPMPPPPPPPLAPMPAGTRPYVTNTPSGGHVVEEWYGIVRDPPVGKTYVCRRYGTGLEWPRCHPGWVCSKTQCMMYTIPGTHLIQAPSGEELCRQLEIRFRRYSSQEVGTLEWWEHNIGARTGPALTIISERGQSVLDQI